MQRAFLLLSSLIFLFACGQKEKVEEVSYRLKWLYNVSTVGDLVRRAQGYFAAERPEGERQTRRPRARRLEGAGARPRPVRRRLGRPGPAGRGQGGADRGAGAALPGQPAALDLPAGPDPVRGPGGPEGQNHRGHLRRQRRNHAAGAARPAWHRRKPGDPLQRALRLHPVLRRPRSLLAALPQRAGADHRREAREGRRAVRLHQPGRPRRALCGQLGR